MDGRRIENIVRDVRVGRQEGHYTTLLLCYSRHFLFFS
jgi:hypothetical protein